MSNQIRSHADAYKTADHVNEKLPIGGTFEVAGYTIRKDEDRYFWVQCPQNQPAGMPLGGRYLGCELADCLIWPLRKEWNKAIKKANPTR